MIGFDEWLTPERMDAEEAGWAAMIAERKGAYRNAEQVSASIVRFGVTDIIEFGCGSGLIPYLLQNAIQDTMPLILSYLGLDNNDLCIQKAKDRNPLLYHAFSKSNIINSRLDEHIGFDIACTFSVMKHIPLGHWQRVWRMIQDSAGVVVASLNMSKTNEPIDDGTEYVHNWVPESWIFTGPKVIDCMLKTWEDEEKCEILVTLVDEALLANARPS
jgi:hypothetical protein